MGSYRIVIEFENVSLASSANILQNLTNLLKTVSGAKILSAEHHDKPVI